MVSEDDDIWHHYRADAEEALREIEGALTAALNALAPGSGAVPAAVLA